MGILSAKIGHFLCIKRLISMGCLGPTQCSMSRPGGPPHPGEVQERVPLGCGIGRVANFKLRNVDELVKSHIPYVVYASTKPVLSEPSTLRQAPSGPEAL